MYRFARSRGWSSNDVEAGLNQRDDLPLHRHQSVNVHSRQIFLHLSAHFEVHHFSHERWRRRRRPVRSQKFALHALFHAIVDFLTGFVRPNAGKQSHLILRQGLWNIMLRHPFIYKMRRKKWKLPYECILIFIERTESTAWSSMLETRPNVKASEITKKFLTKWQKNKVHQSSNRYQSSNQSIDLSIKYSRKK